MPAPLLKLQGNHSVRITTDPAGDSLSRLRWCTVRCFRYRSGVGHGVGLHAGHPSAGRLRADPGLLHRHRTGRPRYQRRLHAQRAHGGRCHVGLLHAWPDLRRRSPLRRRRLRRRRRIKRSPPTGRFPGTVREATPMSRSRPSFGPTRSRPTPGPPSGQPGRPNRTRLGELCGGRWRTTRISFVTNLSFPDFNPQPTPSFTRPPVDNHLSR